MRRILLALVLLLPLARAGGCENYDVVLEIEEPAVVLAGAEFELDGEKMVFSGGACLDFDSSTLQANQIVYDRQERLLRAEGVIGTVSGWKIESPMLTGHADAIVFAEPVFERGDTRVTATMAKFRDGVLELEDLLATTSRYRFRATRGWIDDDVFKAENVWSTPCKCGSAIEITAAAAEFAFAAGKLYLRQADFRLYGLDLARWREILVEPEKEMQLEFPFRFSYGGGWDFGVENLPLMPPSEVFGRWSTHVTALARGVGGPLYEGKTEALLLGFDYRGTGEKIHFSIKPVRVWNGASWDGRVEPDIAVKRDPVAFGVGWDDENLTATGYFMLSKKFSLARTTVAPFVRMAKEPDNTGLSVGAGGDLLAYRYRLEGWRFGVRLPYVAAFYPDAPPYFWAGGRLDVTYGKLFSLRAEFYRALGVPRYSYESRAPRELLKLRVGESLWLEAGYRRNFSVDLATGLLTAQRLRYEAGVGWRTDDMAAKLKWTRDQTFDASWALVSGGEKWRLETEAAGHVLTLAWNRGWDGSLLPTRSEVWFSYRPPLADCAGGWRLSPSIGYDLLGGGVSRVGLDLELNDCCFTWKVGYSGVFDADAAGTSAGHNVTFGVNIR